MTEELGASGTLQQSPVAAAVLVLHSTEVNLTLSTDTCDKKLDFADARSARCSKKMLQYWPRIFDSAELNYDKMHGEYLAVAWALLHLRPCLE